MQKVPSDINYIYFIWMKKVFISMRDSSTEASDWSNFIWVVVHANNTIRIIVIPIYTHTYYISFYLLCQGRHKQINFVAISMVLLWVDFFRCCLLINSIPNSNMHIDIIQRAFFYTNWFLNGLFFSLFTFICGSLQ